MRDHSDDCIDEIPLVRTPRWKTILMKDNPDERPFWWSYWWDHPVPDERPLWWKTILMRDHSDDHTDETTLRDHPGENTQMKDHSDERQSWWETDDHIDETTLRDHPGENTQMKDHSDERKSWWETNPLLTCVCVCVCVCARVCIHVCVHVCVGGWVCTTVSFVKYQ